MSRKTNPKVDSMTFQLSVHKEIVHAPHLIVPDIGSGDTKYKQYKRLPKLKYF